MVESDLVSNETVLSGESFFVTLARLDGTDVRFRTMTFAFVTLKATFVCKCLTVTRSLSAYVRTIVLVLMFSITT